MRLEYRRRPELPKLAWLCEVQQAKHIAVAHVGASVETTGRFFVEGVWAGPYRQGSFHRTECFFGSGAVVEEDSICFVSSTATTDALYYRQYTHTVTVSNSLPFLLAHTADHLDPYCFEYDMINESIIHGIDAYQPSIPTCNGHVVRLLFRNLRITEHSVDTVSKPLPPPFQCYEEYFDHLRRNYALIVTNCRSLDRREPMPVFSTQSRGYDTTAVNSIASAYGIDKVFTCVQAKGNYPFANRDRRSQRNDDGTNIARQLGLDCIPIDRRRFERDFRLEYLYYAAQNTSQDANLLDINDHVTRPTILLTGVLGEIWYPRESSYRGPGGDLFTPELKRGDLGGHGVSEVRLTVGFVQVAIPYIGAQRRAEIVTITESAAMDRWRLNVDYDRPIARRIAEEAGVSREIFGQVKMASVVEFVNPQVPWQRDLRTEYLDFLADSGLLPRWRRPIFPLVRRLNEAMAHRPKTRWYLEKLLSKVMGRKPHGIQLWRHLNGAIFCFAVNKRIRDYVGATTAD